ncbi:hypothetical protein LR48_Vigan08g029200 [Vigna angularis]|uniref:Uncharacterized protein n=1 Tax=Phaseolus angularis TaxID=3914 RepID=A0A0L9V354_PHAAN|nr:hypothetical protein LR48_Vigan08g029200 [Vigna angularis]
MSSIFAVTNQIVPHQHPCYIRPVTSSSPSTLIPKPLPLPLPRRQPPRDCPTLRRPPPRCHHWASPPLTQRPPLQPPRETSSHAATIFAHRLLHRNTSSGHHAAVKPPRRDHLLCAAARTMEATQTATINCDSQVAQHNRIAEIPPLWEHQIANRDSLLSSRQRHRKRELES